jgi:hypothetical protein
MVTFICGNCGKRHELPPGGLPPNWRPATKGLPHMSHLRAPANFRPPPRTVVAMCSKVCDDAHTINMRQLALDSKG